MSSDFWSPSLNPEIQFCGRMLPKVLMSKSVATAHASINQFVPRLNKREPDSFETDVSSAGLCMKCAYKRYPSYPSRPAKQTNRNIRSKSTMRSLHLLGFLVLLAVLSSSMAHHTPDHPDTTTNPGWTKTSKISATDAMPFSLLQKGKADRMLVDALWLLTLPGYSPTVFLVKSFLDNI